MGEDKGEIFPLPFGAAFRFLPLLWVPGAVKLSDTDEAPGEDEHETLPPNLDISIVASDTVIAFPLLAAMRDWLLETLDSFPASASPNCAPIPT